MSDEYIEGEVITPKEFKVFEGLEFQDCKFQNIEVNTETLNNCKFIECRFEKCNLSNGKLLNSVFRDVKFSHCKLTGMNFADARTLAELSFEECVMDYVVFQGIELAHFKAENCNLKEAIFSDGKFQKASFNRSNLHNTSFSGSDLTGADFRNATNYFIDPEFTKLKKAKFSMPEAMVLLKAMDISVE